MRAACLALALVGCAGTPVVAREPVIASSPADVAVAADATLGELLQALEAALATRGHEGECFLAWDEGGELVVRIGPHERRAAVRCGGLGELAAVQGRCIGMRFLGVDAARRPRGVVLGFAPPGMALTTTPPRIVPTSTRADELLREPRGGVRVVIGVDVAPSGSATSGKQGEPLDDPELQQALEQAVRRVQSCNPSAQGSLVVRFRVLRDGTIEDVQRLSSTVSEEAEACAIERLAASSFPEHPREEPDEHCVPVMLDPALR